MTATRTPILFRKPELVLGLLHYVYDEEEPIPWVELVSIFSDPTPWKTVEATIYDLVKFGALHRIGKPGNRHAADTRALKPTALGRAWLDGELLEVPS